MAVQGRFIELLDGSGTDRDEAGGKAWALDRLVEFGFAVPSALVIHAAAYKKFTAAGPIVALLEELRREPLPSVASAGDVEAAIEDVFVSQPMPGRLVDELLPVAKGFLAHGAVAVRSSATCEDAVESSSAGQYRTFLELRTLDDIFDAIRRCWASLWFPAPRAYRRHVGIGDDGIAMAVILQRQVAAVWSGVMFTRDPQGDGGTLRIESVPGLGEALVSGRVTPGDFVVDRRSLAVDRGRSEPPPFIEDLARLGLRVERRAGGPQDVEWSIADGRIWVLQSRPITASGSRAPHDDGFDTDAPTKDTFTSEGVAEMLPGVMAPLVWTINRPMVEDAFRRMFDRLDAVAPDYDRPIIARFRGRAALNLSVVREVTASLPSGNAEEVDAAYLGPDHIAADDAESPRNRASLRALIRNWRAQRRVEDEVRVLCTAVSCLSVIEPEPRELAVANLLAYRRELRDLAWRGTAAELAASAAAGAAYGSLEMLLGRWLGEDAGAETAQRLTSGGLARVMVGPSRLNQIRAVMAAHSSSDLGDVLDTVPASDLRGRLLAADSRLVRAIEKEAVGFGSIASYAGSTFAEDPGRLWQMVKAARTRAIPSVDTDDALKEVVDSLGSGRRWRLLRILSGQIVDLRRRLLIRMAQDAVRFLTLREEAKGALLSLGGIERRVILDGAGRLVRSGHLASASDIDLLTDIEFEELLLDGEPVAAMALRRRVAALAAARDGRSLPSVFVGRPDGAPLDLVESETLTGWAASAGVVRGRVRHIRDMDDGDRLQPGEIIVAVSTDPSWTPLFMAAGGIVLERGGPLSHAAIVARELQLPAVLNVADATRRLADGVLVEVDGRRGVVSVVAEAPSEVEVLT